MARAVLANGEALTTLIRDLVDRGAPVYKGTAEATSHKGYIGLVFADGCIERFSVDEGYKYLTAGDFLKIFKGKQLACL